MSRRSRRKGRRPSKHTDPFYLSKHWRELRLFRLQMDDYKCAHCRTECRPGNKAAAVAHVDHVISRKERSDLEYELSNLVTLCASCHSKKTRADEQPRPAIGADGFPLEAVGVRRGRGG